MARPCKHEAPRPPRFRSSRSAGSSTPTGWIRPSPGTTRFDDLPALLRGFRPRRVGETRAGTPFGAATRERIALLGPGVRRAAGDRAHPGTSPRITRAGRVYLPREEPGQVRLPPRPTWRRRSSRPEKARADRVRGAAGPGALLAAGRAAGQDACRPAPAPRSPGSSPGGRARRSGADRGPPDTTCGAPRPRRTRAGFARELPGALVGR